MRIKQATDLVIGLRGVAGERLHQRTATVFSSGVKRILSRDLRRPRRQLRIGRDDAQLELTLEGLLSILVPTLIELTLELVHPSFGTWCGAWVAPGA